uniref:(northern house mosquito) hypothetical protein n=1 Tax=Culex pipiens TaxID=7175 RepID=A0A8D8ESP2_CULPI
MIFITSVHENVVFCSYNRARVHDYMNKYFTQKRAHLFTIFGTLFSPCITRILIKNSLSLKVTQVVSCRISKFLSCFYSKSLISQIIRTKSCLFVHLENTKPSRYGNIPNLTKSAFRCQLILMELAQDCVIPPALSCFLVAIFIFM